MNHPFSNEKERDQFLASLWGLHEEIVDAVSAPRFESARLLRLIALGVSHCLVGVAAAMAEAGGVSAEPERKVEAGEDAKQLLFAFMDNPKQRKTVRRPDSKPTKNFPDLADRTDRERKTVNPR